MHVGRIIFAQIMDFLPRDTFNAYVRKSVKKTDRNDAVLLARFRSKDMLPSAM